jgi:glycosyltransferase involved in cell wall biosynthesis
MSPRVSVVIPALNEARNLPRVFSRLPEDIFEVILVDGGSVDDTVPVARALRPGVRVMRQSRRGKGNALACGFAACRGDIIVMIDADGSADPAEIPAFVAALRSGADFAAGKPDGYNVFWRHCLGALELLPDAQDKDAGMRWGDGFEIEAIINNWVARAGLTVVEVAGFEQLPIRGESNSSATRDGLRMLRNVLRERSGRQRTVTGRLSSPTLTELAARNRLPRTPIR